MKRETFIMIWGIMMMVYANLSTYLLLQFDVESEWPRWSYYIEIGTSIFSLVAGIGILIRRKWGYYLLKFVLYILFPSFPIGTYISWSSLKYMKKNNVKELYQKWI